MNPLHEKVGREKLPLSNSNVLINTCKEKRSEGLNMQSNR